MASRPHRGRGSPRARRPVRGGAAARARPGTAGEAGQRGFVLRGAGAAVGVADGPAPRPLGLLLVQRPHGPASPAGLRDAAAPALRYAGLDALAAPAPAPPAAARPAPDAALGRLRDLQPRARGLAPAAALQRG